MKISACFHYDLEFRVASHAQQIRKFTHTTARVRDRLRGMHGGDAKARHGEPLGVVLPSGLGCQHSLAGRLGERAGHDGVDDGVVDVRQALN